jgi:hypothetical protein
MPSLPALGSGKANVSLDSQEFSNTKAGAGDYAETQEFSIQMPRFSEFLRIQLRQTHASLDGPMPPQCF